jgi:hypothetical protein
MKTKQGELTTKEIIEFVLGGAVIVLLVILLIALISPYWDKNEQTAKSYFKTLQDEIKKADEGGVGDFNIWQNQKDAWFYVVYFGDKVIWRKEISYFYGEKKVNALFSFVNSFGENALCICYGYPESFKNRELISFECDYCMKLSEDVRNEEFFASRFYIVCPGSEYYFSRDLDSTKIYTVLEEIKQEGEEAKKKTEEIIIKLKEAETAKEEQWYDNDNLFLIASSKGYLIFGFDGKWEVSFIGGFEFDNEVLVMVDIGDYLWSRFEENKFAISAEGIEQTLLEIAGQVVDENKKELVDSLWDKSFEQGVEGFLSKKTSVYVINKEKGVISTAA